ncbi:UDP-N-acetylmuramoyl-L-alanine--D-glutamate ligase [Methylobacillus gramineus]|uniref:UDP-N-acetylmuramoyl-L-alanine--D-glutamate ligase n=1 Tax=Methylobacillus gramineus TaxID=755169 RepID=UPI001CFF83EF|nr:UDP-N-acetylmuramoyl-L-alanine--D-glutamate ligase [Methylobacillus gramineus]MCB5186202.1 UDP-N-acetylmuramoyl-L-alanine--D-glutamate ligase [Methylobacillus gramineus]
MLQLKDKNVLVLGLGDTGLSALRWLKRQGALLSVADTRLVPPGLDILQRELPEIPIYLGGFSQESFAGADVIVASPGVALAEPQIQLALQQGIPVVGDVELFAQFRSPAAKLIAITGANGKSTVTSLVGDMCRAAGLNTVVAGNIGLPVLDALDDAADVYVLELSSFQLETTHSLVADAATVLNISEDHMDRYRGLRDYAAAKARIFSSLGVQVLNREDSWSKSMALPGRRVVSFGTDAPVSDEAFGLVLHESEYWLAQGATRLLKMNELKITGLHNAANALAALALCRAIDLPDAPLLAALREFKGLPHRVEWIAEVHDIAFYDDSKGTNVGATCAAIAGLQRKVVLIAGGDGKGQDFSPLIGPVSSNARGVVLIGRDAEAIAAALAGTGVLVEYAASLEQAVEQAYALAQAGDAVLLSPACASLDMFRHYIHRAQVFVDAVHALVARESRP